MSFAQSNLSSGNYTTELSGTNGIASRYNSSNSYLYNSTDRGNIWTLIITVT